jgi:hypothetical protein
MMEFIILMLFFGFCITTTVVNGSIFEKFRNWTGVKVPLLYKLITCVMCFGFWVGASIFWTLTFIGKIGPIGEMPIWFNLIFYPFIQSTLGVFMESIIIFLRKA